VIVSSGRSTLISTGQIGRVRFTQVTAIGSWARSYIHCMPNDDPLIVQKRVGRTRGRGDMDREWRRHAQYERTPVAISALSSLTVSRDAAKRHERPEQVKSVNKSRVSTTSTSCREPLFASSDNFDSGCGWPSSPSHRAGRLSELRDNTPGMIRTEVRLGCTSTVLLVTGLCRWSAERGGLRNFCILASLRFIHSPRRHGLRAMGVIWIRGGYSMKLNERFLPAVGIWGMQDLIRAMTAVSTRSAIIKTRGGYVPKRPTTITAPCRGAIEIMFDRKQGQLSADFGILCRSTTHHAESSGQRHRDDPIESANLLTSDEQKADRRG